jgi:hypothetical protein
MFRLFGWLAVIALGSAYCAAYEGTPEGSGRSLVVAVGVLLVPFLWSVGELLGSPLIDFLESRPWWAQAGSAIRIALGVAVALPLFAFLVAALWLFRKWFGVPGW